MRGHLILPFACLALGCIRAPDPCFHPDGPGPCRGSFTRETSPAPRVFEYVRNDYYAVEGRTAAEVRSAMDRIGPVDVDARVDARTTSFVRWSYPYERRADGCRTGSHRVDVTVTYLLPEWRPPPDTPSALVDRWHVYQRALFAHESGHELYAVRAATLLSAFLEQLPTFATCGEVDAAANAAGAYVLDELHKVERRYDNVTRHGETQGAIFR